MTPRAIPAAIKLLESGEIFDHLKLAAAIYVHERTARKIFTELHDKRRLISVVGWIRSHPNAQWSPQYKWGRHREPPRPDPAPHEERNRRYRTKPETKDLLSAKRRSKKAMLNPPKLGLWGL